MTAFLAALASADRWLLLKINREWTCATLDAMMPAITDLHKVAWAVYGVVPGVFALWLWKGRRRALQVFVVAALAVSAGDLLAYRVIKPWAARLRPERAGVSVKIRAPISGTYGFPSNHAVNAGAAAAVMSVAYPGYVVAFSGGALLVAYSRVYVGAHYPSDVLAGLALGAAIGWLWAALMLNKQRR